MYRVAIHCILFFCYSRKEYIIIVIIICADVIIGQDILKQHESFKIWWIKTSTIGSLHYLLHSHHHLSMSLITVSLYLLNRGNITMYSKWTKVLRTKNV